jgi:hypothetical protein
MKQKISPYTILLGVIIMLASLANNFDPMNLLSDHASLHNFNLKIGAIGLAVFFIGIGLSFVLNPVNFYQKRPKHWANDKLWRR